jgi:hypothetical protein
MSTQLRYLDLQLVELAYSSCMALLRFLSIFQSLFYLEILGKRFCTQSSQHLDNLNRSFHLG